MAAVRAYGSTYNKSMSARRTYTSTSARNTSASATARKVAASASTSVRNSYASASARKAATSASTSARNTSASTATRKAATSASTSARNTSVKMVGGSYQTNRTGAATAQSAVVNALKGVGSSIQRNPLSGTDYILKPPTGNTTTVLNIVDKTLGQARNGVSKGVSVFRVDSPHGPAHNPVTVNHFNTNSSLYTNNKIYQALNHKPISDVTYSVAKNYQTIGKVAKVGGRALTALAIAGDTIDIYDSYKADGGKIGRNTVVTSAEVAGSWTGGIGGSKLGAMGGAAIGTAICPGLGTLVGGVVGGIVGGVGGSFVGKTAGGAVARAAYNMHR